MSRVATLLARWLIQRCVLTGRAPVAHDVDGQPIVGWGTPTAAVPCRLTDLTDEELLDRRLAGATHFSDALVVPRETVVAINDRVTQIEAFDWPTQSWVLLEGGPFQVVGVATRYADAAQYRRLLLDRTG